PNGTDVWLPPARIVPELDANLGDVTKVRGLGYLSVVARLKEGVSPEQAETEMAAIDARLVEEYPQANASLTVKVAPLGETITGQIRPVLLLLFGAVAFLLIIACTNVANLMLGAASTRQREIAIRSALGATSTRIVRQLLTESVILALAGGALGLTVADWGLKAVVAVSASAIPRAAEIRLDGRALAFAMAVSCAAGILFGLAPALPVYY
ncbi:MAG TPA: FtsX-like permease family protein, partial [Blastocatellia bacterium]